MKPTLPTNYKDDILNTSVEGMRRYQMIYNSDNTVSFKDVTPYDQTGSDFGAGDINLTNQAVNQSADAGKIIDDPDTAEATTEEGYIAGVQLFNHVSSSLGNISNIGNDTYNSFEKLLQYYIDNGYLPDVNSIALIPTMTSANSPSGVVSASSEYTTANRLKWHAFDGNTSTWWNSNTGITSSTEAWLQYKFDTAANVRKIFISTNGVETATYKFQASNDGSEFVDLATINHNGFDSYYNIQNENNYLYYRLVVKTQTGSNSYKGGIVTLQFYA